MRVRRGGIVTGEELEEGTTALCVCARELVVLFVLVLACTNGGFSIGFGRNVNGNFNDNVFIGVGVS